MLIAKVDNLTAAYRDGSLDRFHQYVTMYHTDFVNWKLQKLSDDKARIISEVFAPIA